MNAAENGRYELIVSERLLREAEDVLLRPKFRRYFPEEAVWVFLGHLHEVGAMHEEGEIRPASPDPKDDYLVALARASNAGSLVSGDSHLLDLNYLSPFMIVTPRDFLDELERSG